MALVKILARGWKIYAFDQAQTDAGTNDVFQRVRGITTFGVEPDAETADTTDFDTDGYDTHLVAGRTNSISLEGHYKEDDTDGTQDPGQQIVNDLGQVVGPTAQSRFRLVSPGGMTKEYNASVTPGAVGGGVKDPTSWGATLNVSGKPTTIDSGSDSATYND